MAGFERVAPAVLTRIVSMLVAMAMIGCGGDDGDEELRGRSLSGGGACHRGAHNFT